MKRALAGASLLVALYLGAAFAFAPKEATTCAPACAHGEECAKRESCGDDGCETRFECEGTPDDCRTNGCDADHTECRWQHGNAYACEPKTCYARPTYMDCIYCWRCAEWGTADNCCHEWRYEEIE